MVERHKRWSLKLEEKQTGKSPKHPLLLLGTFFPSFLGRLPPLSPLSSHFLSARCPCADPVKKTIGKSLAESGEENRWVRSGVQPGQVKSTDHLQRCDITVWVSEEAGQREAGGVGVVGERGGGRLCSDLSRVDGGGSEQQYRYSFEKAGNRRQRACASGITVTGGSPPARLPRLGLLYLPNRFTPPLLRHASPFSACTSIPLRGVGEPLNGSKGRRSFREALATELFRRQLYNPIRPVFHGSWAHVTVNLRGKKKKKWFRRI